MQTERQNKLAVTIPGDEWNPVTAVAVLLGKKWHTVVLHRLFVHGPLGFNELGDRIEGISNKVLSACLDDLEARGLVSRRIVSEKPFRVEYALTDIGETLDPVISAMEDWGENEVTRVVTGEAADIRVPR